MVEYIDAFFLRKKESIACRACLARVKRRIMNRIKNISKVLGLILSVSVLSACTSPGVDNKDVSGTRTPASNDGSSIAGASTDADTSGEGASNEDAASNSETTDVDDSDNVSEKGSDQSASAATEATIYRDPISNQEPVKDGYLNIVFFPTIHPLSFERF